MSALVSAFVSALVSALVSAFVSALVSAFVAAFHGQILAKGRRKLFGSAKSACSKILSRLGVHAQRC